MKTNRFIAAMAAMVMAASTAMAQKYVDASTLNVQGRTKPSQENPYFRVDSEGYDFAEEHIVRYCRYPVGVYIMFKTDSHAISAKWTTAKRAWGNNMTPIVQRGLDLYIKKDGVWTFAGVARPSMTKDVHKYTIVKNMADGEKECMLYLPIWNEVESLEIGIDDDAAIEAIPSPYKYKVLTLGSSITHGASASRPGMIFTARMSRSTGIDFVNLGFSGNCKLQPQLARLIADSEADAYLFDAFSNPSVKEIETRVADFVRTVAEAHPDKPMIFLQRTIRDDATFDTKWAKSNDERRATVRRMMTELAKKYDNVYFLDSDTITGTDHEGTVDGAHPTDMGFDRFIDTWLPKIEKILKKYGIK